MIDVITFLSPEYQSSTYVLVNKDYNNTVIIDPTISSVKNILAFHEKNNLEVQYILPTHGHFDHIEGIDELCKHYKADVIANHECGICFQNSKKNYSFFFENKNLTLAPPTVIINDEYHSLSWCNEEIMIIKTPGHSPCSACLHVQNYLFSGDTILLEYNPFTKFPDSNPELLKKSILKIYSEFPKDLMIYPGHGKPFTLGSISSKFKFIAQ